MYIQSCSYTAKELLLRRLNGFIPRTTWVGQYQLGKASLDLHDAGDDGVLGCSGISRTICKQPAPHCRQITTSTPHHSIFYRPAALPDDQPTVSKHWRHTWLLKKCMKYVKIWTHTHHHIKMYEKLSHYPIRELELWLWPGLSISGKLSLCPAYMQTTKVKGQMALNTAVVSGELSPNKPKSEKSCSEKKECVISIYLNTVKTARNLVSWFSGKSLKLLPPDVII